MTLETRFESMPVGTEDMLRGTARDGFRWTASILRDEGFAITVVWEPEYPGAEPFRLRREFTRAAYAAHFIQNL